jgi:CRISPR system Cascade subunit CasB
MDEKKVIHDYVKDKIDQLVGGDTQQAANLARLRRCVGKPPEESSEVWEITLSGLPVKLQSCKGEPSYVELVIHIALTLFAVHQQGKGDSVSKTNYSFGRAVSYIRMKDGETNEGVERRFAAAIAAKSLSEFAHHARGLIQLLKANEIPIDYPLLAKDMYDYQKPESRNKVLLRWGEHYYRENSMKDTDSQKATIDESMEEE